MLKQLLESISTNEVKSIGALMNETGDSYHTVKSVVGQLIASGDVRPVNGGYVRYRGFQGQ